MEVSVAVVDEGVISQPVLKMPPALVHIGPGPEVDKERAKKCLLCLRGLIQESPIQYLPQELLEDDRFLLRFVRVRKFDCERAYIMLKDYSNLRKKNKTLTQELYPSHFKHVLDLGMHLVLKQRDPWGRKVFLFRTGLWNPDKVSLNVIISVTMLLLEEMVDSEETQMEGVVLAADQGGLGFKHFRQFTIPKILFILSALQGKFPLLCKGLHSINEPGWLMKLGAFAIPFFSAKMQKRVHFHGHDLASLKKFFPAQMLPESLGGTLSWEDAVDGEFYERLYSKDSYYKRISLSQHSS